MSCQRNSRMMRFMRLLIEHKGDIKINDLVRASLAVSETKASAASLVGEAVRRKMIKKILIVTDKGLNDFNNAE